LDIIFKIMYIVFNSKKIKKVCENFELAKKKHGEVVAKSLIKRLDQIKAFPELGDFILSRLGHCHPLEGSRKGQFAVDLDKKKRLVFKPVIDEYTKVGELDFYKVKKVIVLEVKNYHHG